MRQPGWFSFLKPGELKAIVVFFALLTGLPFVHEAIHWTVAWSFGFSPRFNINLAEGLLQVEFYGSVLLPVYTLFVYSPELVFLPIAAFLTWKFRANILTLAAVPLPLLLISITGFYGHVFL